MSVRDFERERVAALDGGLSPEQRQEIEKLPVDGYICIMGEKRGPYIAAVKDVKDTIFSYEPPEEVSDTELAVTVPTTVLAPWLLKQNIVTEEEAREWLRTARTKED